MILLRLVIFAVLILSISSCGSVSLKPVVRTDVFKNTIILSSSDWIKPDLWPVTDWALEVLSTAADADFLDDLEKDVNLHLNMARTDPARYARDFIEPRMEYFSGVMYREVEGFSLLTREGVGAVVECVSDMEDTDPMTPLLPSADITPAALDHALDLSLTGETGHIGSDRSGLSTRLERYGQWLISIGEVISYGPATGREIVTGLLIDDGVPDRGHRTIILNPNFRLVGIAVEEHPAYGNICVIDFAVDFESAP